MTTLNRTETQAQDMQILAGIKKDLPTLSNLPLAGTTYSMVTLTALLESRIDAASAVRVARAIYAQAIDAYQAVNTKVIPVVRGLRQYLINANGPTATHLADFGFVPSKRATSTPEQKVAAVAKRAATRKARGTVGPKARLAITGETAKLAALQSQASGATAPAPTPAATAVTVATPSRA
jgi:hypothetical protein